jgi:hypothetical protein
MSGIKPPELTSFYSHLHARGWDTVKLAQSVCLSRSTITRVLNGSRRPGHVWIKLKPFLTPDEIQLVHVAHCSAWNTKRVAKRPKWTAAKAAELGPKDLRHDQLPQANQEKVVS